MFNQEFCLKYFFRLGHMLSVITLGGKVIMDYLFPCLQSQQTTGSNVFFGSMGSLLIISGFVNTYILPGKEKLQNKYSFWMGALQIKMITSKNLYISKRYHIFNSPLQHPSPQDIVRFPNQGLSILFCVVMDNDISIPEILQGILDRK